MQWSCVSTHNKSSHGSAKKSWFRTGLTPCIDRGEGANHAIVDVLDLKQKVLPCLASTDNVAIAAAIKDFENDIIARTRPAVLASRRACLDAHDWQRLTPSSPLLSRRQMQLDFTE